MKRPLLISLALLLTLACTKTDEEKRLTRFRKSIPYKTYRMTSAKMTELALAEYKKNVNVPLEPAWLHATVGFLCLLGGRSEYAYIESELAKEGPSLETAILGQGVQSVALSKLGATHLAQEQFTKLKKNLARQQEQVPARGDDFEMRLMFVSLMAAGIYHDDSKLALFAAKRLATHPSFDYLPSLVSTLLELKKGHTEKALQQLQTLTQNRHFPESKRQLLTETLAVLEQGKLQTPQQDALVDQLVLQITNAILEDLFSTENQQEVLGKITSFSKELTKGLSYLQPTVTNTLENVSSPQ